MKDELPPDKQKAKELILSKPQYEVIVCCNHLEGDKTMQIVPPVEDSKALFESVHSGLFGRHHLLCEKMHRQLTKYYWWPGTRGHIVQYSQDCCECVSRQVGKPIHPFLSPIPELNPLDRVGVDVIQFTTSSKGHKYAVVFVDYLIKWPKVFHQALLTVA